MGYTITEVAKQFNLSPHTIRFYDKEGLLPFVSRNKSGNREFTESDLSLFKLICCLKNTGMTIKNIKKYIESVMEGTGTVEQRRTLLKTHREVIVKQMEEFQASLTLIDSKIEKYDSPDAVILINDELRQVSEEKSQYGLTDWAPLS
ncbi:MerR family transcriptional regulator [Paenibacillus sp. XY044]|uniref:MerR family transcriptional regulator n=1 Tax=Paenibacillus sp. XY044 TaxID=2026089 RepID=UPI000B987CAD|nr:MerR family transcriptional regulator [Paenibacillus sp. XY044]OZB95424.1 MerR family transcriptional regulator [Paenibacillus sp. XY044]